MRLFLLTFCALILTAQENSSPAAAGVASQWDTRQSLTKLAENMAYLQPMINRINARTWLEQGAPDAYVAQSERAQNEMGYLTTTAQKLAQQPDRLSLALETFLRLQSLESLVNSLEQGLRKYQSNALADHIRENLVANAPQKDRLRQHMQDLAAAQEQEMQVMDSEAQRCRGLILTQTPAAPAHPTPRRKPK